MKYILSADDDPINQFLLSEALGDNYEIEVVADGVACLESIANRTPDLLLLDVSMPRMNGFEVCRTIRKNNDANTFPIIFLSAAASLKDIENGMGAGADGYITKPFSIDTLLTKIERFIGC